MADTSKGVSESEYLRVHGRAIDALEKAGIDFLIPGGIPSTVFAGSEWNHEDEDVDVMVRPVDAERAERALVGAGFRPKPVAEDWLRKVESDGVTVDILLRPEGAILDHEMLRRHVDVQFKGLALPLLSVEDFAVTKIAAFKEETPKYWHEAVRAVERKGDEVDWDYLCERGAGQGDRLGAFLLFARAGGVKVPPPVIERTVAPSGR